MEKQFTMQDIERLLGFSPPWVRKIEKNALLQFKAPKGRGRAPRLYSEKEVANLIRLATMRRAGYSLDELDEHITKAERLKELILKYQRTDGRGDPVALAFLHDPIGSIGLDSPVTIYWPAVPPEDAAEIKDLMVWFLADSKLLLRGIEKFRKKAEQTLQDMAQLERAITKLCVPVMKESVKGIIAR